MKAWRVLDKSGEGGICWADTKHGRPGRTRLLSEDYAKDLLVDAAVPKGQGGVE